MAFREDIVPECRSTAHPAHTDRRRWMTVVRQERDYVSWCCQRCTEITGVYAIQVQILEYGRKRGLHALGFEQWKHRRPAPKLQLPAGLRVEKPKEVDAET